MSLTMLTEQLGGVSSAGLPSDTGALPGGSTPLAGASIKFSGNLFSQTPAGGQAPAGTAAGYIVALATIQAGAFDAANRCATITANGNFAANGNTKTVSIVVNPTTPAVGSIVSGGTTLASTGAVTTNGSAWALGCDIIKTGAKGSNTQSAIHQGAQVGAAVAALTAAQSLTLNEAATITVALVINCATMATDATLWNFQGQWFN